MELTFKQILEDNEHFRFDAEYFKKEYLELDKLLNSSPFLEKLSNKIINFGAYALCNQIEYLDEGVPYINVKDIDDNIIDLSQVKFIDKDLSINLLKKSLVKENQILLTIAGTIGKSVVVKNLPFGTNSNQAIANIDLKNNQNPQYISILLNSKIGKMQTKRLVISNVQPNLLLTQVKKIRIPNLSDIFQIKIEEFANLSHQKLEESKSLYKEAENLLLKELDLLDFQPSTENIAVKKLSESLGDSGRLDSEYYQPKYDEFITKIKSTKYDTLDNIVNIQKSIEPGSDAYQDNGIPFVRVSNLTKYGISEPNIRLSNNLFDDETLEKLQPKKDTILLSKDGTVGIAYNTKENSNLITSGALLHLTIKENYFGKVFNEYLTLVLNSLVVQMQSQRDAGGSIIKHWKPSEIKRVLIPIIDNKVQTQIEQKIKQSFKLKEQSKQLLEIAKKSVEVAIEQDEKIAMEYINEQI